MRTIGVLIATLLLATAAPAQEDPLAAARRHFEFRDHGKAEEALLLRLVDDGEDVEAMKLLADVYLVTERPEDARTMLERAQGIAPEDPTLTVGLWETWLADRDWTPAARKELGVKVGAFLDSAGEHPLLWQLTAAHLGYNLANDKAAKEEIAARIVRMRPKKLPDAVESDLFEGIIVERDTEKRVGRIHEFLELFPESNQRNFVREILLYQLRDDRARLVAEADAILEKEPDNRRVRARLARWLLEGDDPDAVRALAESDRALELLDTPEEIDRPEMASDEDWKRMLHEDRGRYHGYRARAMHLLGRDEEATLAAFRDALKILPHNSRLNLWLGEAVEGSGPRSLAVEAFARAVQSGHSPEAEKRLRGLLPAGAVLRGELAPILGPAPQFVDATGALGLGAVRAGRVSLADVNGDDYPDLLLNGSRLYLNLKGKGFERSEGLPAVPGARGGIFCDLDLDGDQDLFVFRTDHPMVFEGDGKGSFKDRTPEGMKQPGMHLSEGAAVLDHDGDGNLDLYIANYEKRPNPPWARGTHDRLYRNSGGFSFEDASDRLRGLSREPMCGRGATTFDFDDDGDTDLYVANYRLDPDYLLVNGEAGLTNEARARGTEGECDKGYFGHGIGPAAGDLNGDGFLDVVVGNLAHPRYIGFSDVTRIFLNSGPPEYSFRDVFRESGVRFEETHSNASLADVDLDGDLDLYLTSIYKGRKSFLYLNDGSAKFRDVTWLAGVRADNGWGSAFGDLDLDGDVDLVVGSGSGMRVFRNEGPAGGFLGLTLRGRESVNGSGIGARVTLTGPGFPQVREITGGTGTGCQDDPSLRFGVAEHKGPFTLTVRWPGGMEQRIMGVKPNRLYRLVEGGNLVEVRRED